MSELPDLPGDAWESGGGADEEIDKARQDFLLACLENLNSSDDITAGSVGVPTGNQHEPYPFCQADDLAAERQVHKPDNGDGLSDQELAMLTEGSQRRLSRREKGASEVEPSLADEAPVEPEETDGDSLKIDARPPLSDNEIFYRQVVRQIVACDFRRHHQNLTKEK